MNKILIILLGFGSLLTYAQSISEQERQIQKDILTLKGVHSVGFGMCDEPAVIGLGR